MSFLSLLWFYSPTNLVQIKQNCTVFLCIGRYKNNVAIEPLSAPGKYKIENKYGVHSLIISRYNLTHPQFTVRPLIVSSFHFKLHFHKGVLSCILCYLVCIVLF